MSNARIIRTEPIEILNRVLDCLVRPALYVVAKVGERSPFGVRVVASNRLHQHGSLLNTCFHVWLRMRSGQSAKSMLKFGRSLPQVIIILHLGHDITDQGREDAGNVRPYMKWLRQFVSEVARFKK